MTTVEPCPACHCTASSTAHAIVAALREDDLDRAFELGLLDAAPCPGCSDTCTRSLTDARDERIRALAARERYRNREQRLQRRQAERARKRAAATSALPPAAAAALARAKARAQKP